MADDLQKQVIARRQKDLDGYTDKYKKLTDARTAEFAAEVAPIWQRTAQRLEIQVKNLYKEYATAEGVLDAGKMKTIKREIDKLAQMQKQLQKEIKGIEPLVKNKLTKHVAFEFARSHYVSAFGLEQAARVAVNVPLLSYNAVMGVLNNPWLKDGFTYSDRLRANTQYLADKMGQSIGRAMAEGWDVQKTARHIVKTAGEGFYNSVRLARTEITRASAQGASNLYMENADILDGKRWEATLDSRTAAQDAENDGKVYPLEYDTPEMEGAAGERIPNHPNCRCGWAPLLSALGVSDKERVAREGDSKESWGKNKYTKARTYREYAQQRGLPSLDDRLAGDDLRRYLRPGETMAAFKGKPVGQLPVGPQIISTDTPPTVTNFVEATTIAEANAWAKTNLPFDTVDYTGYDIRLANEMNKNLAELTKRYPEVTGIKYVGTGQERNRAWYAEKVKEVTQRYVAQGTPLADAEKYAKLRVKKPKPIEGTTWAESAPPGWGNQAGIAFNEKHAKNYAKLAAGTKHTVEIGWHPVGTETPASIITHEFGHQVDEILKAHGKRGWVNTMFKDMQMQALATQKGTVAYHDLLSRYGATNSADFFAEAFAEYLHNPSPRPIAAEVGRRLEEALAEIRKGVK